MGSDTAKRDGTVTFDGGINSLAVRTLSSDGNPSGLQRNELAWLCNGTVRDGGITQRNGWIRAGIIASSDVRFQGKAIYSPSGENPYEIWSTSGIILKVDLDTGEATNLSSIFGLTHPADQPKSYFAQANRFMVIQAGDNVTLPLIWDGSILRRSNGITGVVGGQPGADYTLNFTNWATIAPVGNTFNCPINAPGPLLGDQGTIGVLGTFEVTNAAALTFQLRTIASDYVGQKLAPATINPDYPFTVNPTPTPANVNEIPAATAMDYYAGRLWYSIGRVVAAGDIIYGPSGTAAYNFADSVLRVTENPLAIGGDGFEVPSQDGNITAIKHGGAIDAALGQGRLFLFTRKAVYGLQVPVNRQDWIDAGAQNQPLMTIVQLVNGAVNDWSVVSVNGDLYYQSLEPGIRSLDQSVRYFSQPGNRKLSANEQRVLRFNDRSLLYAASGIYFDSRLWQTSLPRETPQGVVHDAIIPLDFMPISTFQQERKPNWEGMYEGVPILQMAVADFGGMERAFAAAVGLDNSIELWELTNSSRFDFSTDSNEANRVEWYLETPAFTWSQTIGELELKKLVSGEMWVDKLFGTVLFGVDYRPDSATCWLPWIEWKECSPKNTAETVGLPDDYPVNLGDCYKTTMIFPKPDPECAPCNNNRPANIGLQFQLRIRIKGWCRIRGVWLWAEKVERGMYQPKLVC